MLGLHPAAHEVTRLLDGVTDEGLSASTLCRDTPVAARLDHLVGLCLAFTWAARQSTPVGTGRAPSPGQASTKMSEVRHRLAR